MDHGSAAENGFLDPIARPRRALRLGPRQPRLAHHPDATWSASRTSTSWTTAGPSTSPGCGSPASATPSSPRTAPVTPGRRARRSAAPASGSPPRCATSRPAGTPVDIAVAHEPGRRPARPTARCPWSWPATSTTSRTRCMKLRHPAAWSRAPRAAAGCARSRTSTPEPVEASVLYLDRDTRRLQAWDEITLGGLGLTTAEVSRHLAGGEPTRARTALAYSVRLTPKRRSPVSDVPKGAGQGLTVPIPQRSRKKRNRFGGSPGSPICFSRPLRRAEQKRPGGPISPHRLVAQDAALSRR